MVVIHTQFWQKESGHVALSYGPVYIRDEHFFILPHEPKDKAYSDTWVVCKSDGSFIGPLSKLKVMKLPVVESA